MVMVVLSLKSVLLYELAPVQRGNIQPAQQLPSPQPFKLNLSKDTSWKRSMLAQPDAIKQSNCTAIARAGGGAHRWIRPAQAHPSIFDQNSSWDGRLHLSSLSTPWIQLLSSI